MLHKTFQARPDPNAIDPGMVIPEVIEILVYIFGQVIFVCVVRAGFVEIG
jgi:hypothetical protein